MLAQAILFSDGSGFLGTRGSLMIDFVFLAMFAVLPILGFSIYLAKVKRAYQLHKWIQIVLAVVLLIAVVAFEVDMRFFTDWEKLAEPSPHFKKGEWCLVWQSLAVHLAFAIPTPLLWIVVIVRAMRNFANPPVPNSHSHAHRKLGWLATIGMTLTAITGWIFYWLAFVAK